MLPARRPIPSTWFASVIGLSALALVAGPAAPAHAQSPAAPVWGVYASATLPSVLTSSPDPCDIVYTVAWMGNTRIAANLAAGTMVAVATGLTWDGAQAALKAFGKYFDDMPDGVVKFEPCFKSFADTDSMLPPSDSARRPGGGGGGGGGCPPGLPCPRGLVWRLHVVHTEGHSAGREYDEDWTLTLRGGMARWSTEAGYYVEAPWNGGVLAGDIFRTSGAHHGRMRATFSGSRVTCMWEDDWGVKGTCEGSLVGGGAPDPREPGPGCSDLSGRWTHNTQGIGSAAWTLTRMGGGSYQALESGLDNARGNATFDGRTLTIQWTSRSGYAGVYRWAFDPQCTSGTGELRFTARANTTHRSELRR